MWDIIRAIDALDPPAEGRDPIFATVSRNPGVYILFPRKKFIVTRIKLPNSVGLSFLSRSSLAPPSRRFFLRTVAWADFRSLSLSSLRA